MCGIIGIIGQKAVAQGLLEGLRRLEYRDYDSGGIATLSDGHIECRRAEGKLVNLAKRLESEPAQGVIGIGHTRWATHGLPTETNPHPIATDRVAVVHNGIIENFRALRRELSGLGYAFQTETDTEAVAILATHFLAQGLSPREAVAKTLASARRRLRPGLSVRRRARPDDRCSPRQPARYRLWRRQDVPRLGRLGPGAIDPAHHLPRRG